MSEGQIPMMVSRNLATAAARKGRSSFASAHEARIGEAADIALHVDTHGDDPLTRIANALERIANHLDQKGGQ